MKVRCTKTAAVAWFFEIPAAVRAKMRPASATPMPPPAGEARRQDARHRRRDHQRRHGKLGPKGVQCRPEGEDDEQLPRDLAPEELDNLDRLRRQHLEVLGDRGELGS